jgi:esterase/lipase superfamily enzyme
MHEFELLLTGAGRYEVAIEYAGSGRFTAELQRGGGVRDGSGDAVAGMAFELYRVAGPAVLRIAAASEPAHGAWSVIAVVVRHEGVPVDSWRVTMAPGSGAVEVRVRILAGTPAESTVMHPPPASAGSPAPAAPRASTKPVAPAGPVASPAPVAPSGPAASTDAPAPRGRRGFRIGLPSLPRARLPEPPSPGQKDGGVQRVWYGTNRAPVLEHTEIADYGADRNDRVHVGWCDVRIPAGHRIGSVGSHWLRRLLRRQDDRLELATLMPLAPGRFWSGLGARLAAIPEAERNAVIFVHGYNVTFREGVIRAAQIGFDLGIPCMGLFSWPSKGALFDYTADAAAVEASEYHLYRFLIDFAARAHGGRVHVIAHSMGNRALLRAVQAAVAAAEPLRVGHFVLAAPDVDREVFLRLAANYTACGNRTTIYVSNRDRALALSGAIHRFARAGLWPPLTVIPGADTVHAADVDLSLLGHGFVAETREVLNDIHSLIVNDAPPDRRMGLRQEQSADGPYWVIAR